MKTFVSSSACNEGPGSYAIEEQAADWIARHDAGLSSAEEAELGAWLAADPRHAAVFTELKAAWVGFNRARIEGRGEALFQNIAERAMRTKRRNRRAFAFATGALAAAAALVFAFLPNNPLPPAAAPTFALSPDRQVLPDGSLVELNAGAQVAIEFTPERRVVRLVHGEALFDVASDQGRPFVVSAGEVEVRAVGTAFSVRHARDEIAVLVTQGQVAVDRLQPLRDDGPPGAPPINPKPIYLAAGRKVTVPLGFAVTAPEPMEVSPEELAEALAWRNRRVEFTSTPLAEAVVLFNRHPGRRLVLGDEATGAIRITGVFWTDDPEGFSRLLVSSLGLKADMDAQDRIVLASLKPEK